MLELLYLCFLFVQRFLCFLQGACEGPFSKSQKPKNFSQNLEKRFVLGYKLQNIRLKAACWPLSIEGELHTVSTPKRFGLLGDLANFEPFVFAKISLVNLLPRVHFFGAFWWICRVDHLAQLKEFQNAQYEKPGPFRWNSAKIIKCASFIHHSLYA